MIIVIIKLNARSEKCLELKQSLLAMIEPTRKEKGCLSHNIVQDIENDNDFSLIQMWQSREDLDDYLRSDLFTVFIGTRYLLSRPSEISVNEVTHASEWEDAEAVRG
jgi:quinol monooxygenase YgiN